MTSPIRFALAALLSLLALGQAQADLIPISLNPSPDIFNQDITVSYDSNTQILTATGTAFEINDDNVGSNEPIVGGTFSLQAKIDKLTGLLIADPGNKIEINGAIPTPFITPNQLLLEGNLTDFGFDNSGLFDFTFTPTSGALQSLYNGEGGIIMSGTNFPGSFLADFTNFNPDLGGGAGLADVGIVAAPAVPEPATLTVALVAGGMGLLSRRVRRQKA